MVCRCRCPIRMSLAIRRMLPILASAETAHVRVGPEANILHLYNVLFEEVGVRGDAPQGSQHDIGTEGVELIARAAIP